MDDDDDNDDDDDGDNDDNVPVLPPAEGRGQLEVAQPACEGDEGDSDNSSLAARNTGVSPAQRVPLLQPHTEEQQVQPGRPGLD